MPPKKFDKNKPKNSKKNQPVASKSKRIKNDFDKELKKIYQDEKGRLPKMTGLEFKEKNRALKIFIYIIITLTVLFAVSFLGFLIFQPTPKFTGDKIHLEIKAPFSALSGENINYQIKYTNSEETSLTQAQLIVYLPNGFILESESQPSITKNKEEQKITNIKTWQLNDLQPKQTGSIELSGQLIGAADSKQTISAILSFTPANFSSEFQKSIGFTTEINASLADLKAEYPTQIANLEETEFNLKITNTSKDTELKNLQIKLDYPQEFYLDASQIIKEGQDKPPFEAEKEPEGESKQKIWQIENLPPQSILQINFKGKFDVQETSEQQLNINLELKGPDDEYYLQTVTDLEIEVIKGELLSNLIIQGSNQNKPVNFGETLNYLLTVKNKSKRILGNLKIRAVLDSIILDWTTLKDQNNGLRDSQQILWTKDQIPDLAMLLPEEEVEIVFQINLKNWQENQRYKEEDLQVKSFFETQINKVNNKETELVNQSPIIINLINTNLQLQSEGRYFDDNNQTVGSGPLPPIVGQKTSYRIFWALTNSLHEIKDIEVKAKLPDYVNYEGQEDISTGKIFKDKNNELVWQISRIPTSIKEATAEFSISITPRDEDADKILTLLPEISIQATDAKTNGKINLTNKGITTNLEKDPLAKGKGLIQEE